MKEKICLIYHYTDLDIISLFLRANYRCDRKLGLCSRNFTTLKGMELPNESIV